MEQKSLKRWIRANRLVDRVLLVMLLLAAALAGYAMFDDWRFLEHGMGEEYHDFRELLAVNPDTAGWLRLEGTQIDHPVVQGRDNFEYLDKGFDGNFYAGGCLFLDAANKRDFSDAYNIIHGHHMSGGAMFGGLEHYLDKSYLKEHKKGILLTPERDYDLEILCAITCNAYDPEVYAAGSAPPKRFKGKILALSTCAGDMSDERIVVFCRMINERKHE